MKSERPWRTEREGLFESYRDASEWLINEGFDVYSDKCGLNNTYELYFVIDHYLGNESWIGYIEKWEVK